MKFRKIKPEDIEFDPKYQRELDVRRAQNIADNLDELRIGVPVVSVRSNGTMVVVDGQHRIYALCAAGAGDKPILCEVHDGLTTRKEAMLFLALNGGRTAVRAFDKFRARLVAKEPVAVEIKQIVTEAGLRIERSSQAGTVCAVNAMESVHKRNGNLRETLEVLSAWSNGDPDVFDGRLIKDMSAFLNAYSDAEPNALVERLGGWTPERLLGAIKRMQGSGDMSRVVAARTVIRSIYNHKNRHKLGLAAALDAA